MDEGQLQLKKKIFAEDERPIDEACSCYTCKTYTRAYLNMVTAGEESNGSSLISIHNVAFQVFELNIIKTRVLRLYS